LEPGNIANESFTGVARYAMKERSQELKAVASAKQDSEDGESNLAALLRTGLETLPLIRLYSFRVFTLH